MKMESTGNESRLLIASQALENDPNLRIREATRVYAVPRTTLTKRVNTYTAGWIDNEDSKGQREGATGGTVYKPSAVQTRKRGN